MVEDRPGTRVATAGKNPKTVVLKRYRYLQDCSCCRLSGAVDSGTTGSWVHRGRCYQLRSRERAS
eukprot:257476-Pleurochrysis_carterae.AAC.1